MIATRALTIYRYVFSALLIVASFRTLAHAHGGHASVLASAEIVGALLVLWRQSEIVGAGVLLVVFAAAQVFSALEGSWPTRYAQYAASVISIVLLSRAPLDIARGRWRPHGSTHNDD